jgi:hypothetical protein|tara:strand:- start:351 stop:509 length:159 start_codon:yes stop_codon:yes gene_type:complete
MFTSLDKAIVALLGSFIFIGGYFGLDLEFLGGLAEPVVAVATALLVYFVPNK